MTKTGGTVYTTVDKIENWLGNHSIFYPMLVIMAFIMLILSGCNEVMGPQPVTIRGQILALGAGGYEHRNGNEHSYMSIAFRHTNNEISAYTFCKRQNEITIGAGTNVILTYVPGNDCDSITSISVLRN